MSVSAGATERTATRTPARLYVSGVARHPGSLALVAGFVAEPSTRDFALVNLAVQAVLFVFGACLPAYRTRVMAWTDCAWPWGLFAIGVQALAFGDTGSPVLLIVAGMYVVMGLRGGLWALHVVVTDFPSDDLPRYRYRRLEWRREGYRGETFPMLNEILMQGLANASAVAAPALLVVADRDARVGPVVLAGVSLWALSWALESAADLQKARFGRRAGAAGTTETCEVGLWRYSRHPNYFFEWLQWLALILVALPSLIRLAGDFAVLPWAAFAAALLGIAGGMYYVLVHFTGAIPAEHFSVQHRPGYRDYQQRVNRFFPGPNRRSRVRSR